MDDQQPINSEQRPITDELAALLDDLVLALRDAKTNLCHALQELRQRGSRAAIRACRQAPCD